METEATDYKKEYLTLRQLLIDIIKACDEHGKMIPTQGVCGMTIEAQIRASAYTRVPAWPIEVARNYLLDGM